MRRRKRLVLVDDSADEVEFVRRALASSYAEAELIPFRNGSTALDHLEAGMDGGMPGVVLLDLKLPGLDGHAILRELRKRFTSEQVPVVMFTSSREASDLERAYAAGANSYVVKPLVFEEYAAVVGLVARYWLDVNVAGDPEGGRDA